VTLKRFAGLAAGPLLFALILLTGIPGLDEMAVRVCAVAAWMIAWWIFESTDMAVVSLLPLILFPILGVFTMDQAAAPYSSKIVFLFLGGFFIATAMQKWNLHERIALHLIRSMGNTSRGVIAGFMLSTAFLSMWISNTATALMMLPIAGSIIRMLENKAGKNFPMVLMLIIAYSANIGGTATLIGTPPNTAFAGLLEKTYNIKIDFMQWFIAGFPFALILLILMYVLLVRVLYPVKNVRFNRADLEIDDKIKALGPIRGGERLVIIIFCLTVFLWITKSFIIDLTGWTLLTDHAISVFGGFLLFIIPYDTREARFPLDWKDTTELPWGILLLFGGGLSLAEGLQKAGLIQLIAGSVSSLAAYDIVWLALGLTAIALFATELMSNVALVNVFVPVVFGIASGLNVDPVLLGIPVTLAASCAFMFPISTPPNAVVFSSGKVSIGQMAKAGFLLNLLAIIVIQLVVWNIIRYVLI
jgi:sodium-dependent dicarboxylate transporter 2/3/5